MVANTTTNNENNSKFGWTWTSLREVEIEKNSFENNKVESINVSEKSYIWDKLDEIFEDQKSFMLQINKKFEGKPFNCYNFDQNEYDIYYDCNCAIEELVEAIRELNTKRWKVERKEVDRQKILEELIDASKFIHEAVLKLGYNATDFYEAHKKKSNKNRKRQKEGY